MTPHSHGPVGPVASPSPLVRWITLGLLLLIALGTGLGLAALWPDYGRVAQVADRSQYAVDGVSYERGEILGLSDDCAAEEPPAGTAAGGTPPGGTAANGPGQDGDLPQLCRLASIGIRTGPDAGQMIDLPIRGSLASSGLQTGDEIELLAYPRSDLPAGTGTAESGTSYGIALEYNASGVFRGLPLALLAIVFVAVVVAVGRIRGLLALLALGVSAGVLLGFVLPALVAGGPGLPIGVVGSSTIMFVILYLVHGPNLRTTAALIGTVCGILIMAGVSLVSVQATRLSGIGDEASGQLSAMASEIDFRGLLTCAIIIAGLGILNDVTITQASSVWELRAAAPTMPRRELFSRAMRIGRDHIASTVYTVFFAYVGAAMSVLILMYLYNRPVLSLLTQEDIATEVVRTLCGSIGLVLAVPITTWVATLFAPPVDADGAEARQAAEAPAIRG